MNYGLYVSASGVLTSMYRQDVLANNLANVNTAGYKPDAVATRQREAARVEDGLAGMPSNRLLERLGAGALLAPNRTSFAQGAMETTGNPLDAAIQGPGFFKVSAGAGSGKDRIRLTRDGRFTTDSQGRLMTIKADGGIEQNGVTVARIGLVEAPNLGALQKVGGNMFRPTATQAAGLRPATGTIQPESIERSGVDPIQAMLGITNASMAVSNNARMIQLHDDLMNRAINTLGRVA
jgi:flagellar basal-body rod protein FlgG